MLKRIFVLFFVALVIVVAPTKLLAQEPIIQLSQDGMQSFLDDLFCNYEVGVSESELKGFMTTLYFDTSDPCNVIIPQTTSSTSDSHSFAWNKPPQTTGYTLAYFGLSTGESDVFSTIKGYHNYTGLSAQSYLFIFINNCLGNASVANIIISDKDVFFPVSTGSNEDACTCPGNKSTTIDVSDECELFTTHFFPWANTCYGNKYNFEITIPESEISRQFWLLHGISEGTEPHHVDILECSDGYQLAGEAASGVQVHEFINEPGNFWVHFNSNGVHIYIDNPDWINAEITGGICECYNGTPVLDTDKKLSTNPIQSYIAFEVWPNPTSDQLVIESTNIQNSIITILDAKGKIWNINYFSENENSDQRQLDTSTLPAGIYYLQIESNGYQEVKRIVKI